MRDARDVRARRVWRVWRCWLPAGFRARFELDLLQHHVDRAASAEQSRWHFWACLLWDAALTGAAARVENALRLFTEPDRRRSMRISLQHDGRVVLRRLLRQPAFAMGVIATLALGIAASLTMFSVLDRLLLRPPPGIEDVGDVRRVYVFGPTLFDREPVHSESFSYPEYAAVRDVAGFAEIAGRSAREMTIGHGDDAERIRAEMATASYFRLLGVRAALGRVFTEEDDVLDPAIPVAVLSDAYWRQRFGSDADVLGREVAIGSGRYTIIGVLPDGFTGVDLEAVDVWLPLHAAGSIESGRGWMTSVGWSWINILARLPDGARSEAAIQAEATAHIVAARERLPARLREAQAVFASVIPARGPNAMSEAEVARLLLGLAGLVLLIGCANVVNLLLARGVQRRHQHALQRALGASRARLGFEAMLEALALCTGAGIVAFTLTQAVTPAMFRLLVPDVSTSLIDVDRTVIAAVSAVAALVMLVGAVPSWRAARTDPMQMLRGRGSSASSAWLRRWLLIVQAAVCLVLLAGAGLFVRSLQQAIAVDVGVDTSTLTVELELMDGTNFGERLAGPVYTAYEALRAHPRVADVAITSIVPWGGGWGIDVDVPGPREVDAGVGPFFVSAGPGYFSTVGIPVIRGRALDAQDDRAGAEPVVVVNEAMAELAWPDEDALGKCLLVGEDAQACSRVVGIVGNYRTSLTSDEAEPLFYLPPHHPGIGWTAAAALVLRVHGPPNAATREIAALVRAASPEIRYAKVAPLSERLEPQLRAWRVGAATLVAFGLLALLVAAAGLYAVVTFELNQRRHELAIRAALGGSVVDIGRAMASRTLVFTLAGILIGVAAAVGLGRFVQSLLFDVDATDPLVLGGAACVLAAAALAAFVVPMAGARRTDPMRALRED